LLVGLTVADHPADGDDAFEQDGEAEDGDQEKEGAENPGIGEALRWLRKDEGPRAEDGVGEAVAFVGFADLKEKAAAEKDDEQEEGAAAALAEDGLEEAPLAPGTFAPGSAREV
jgi:hypothetical protein